MTKSRGYMHKHVLGHHPLDVVGWDGYLYPWVFNVEDFEPITGPYSSATTSTSNI